MLITGTTSGLGRALADQYQKRGCRVVHVNRRQDPDQKLSPQTRYEVLDITDINGVRDLLSKLESEGWSPELFILNAGINAPDHIHYFRYQRYQEILRTNLDGVLSFIGAISLSKYEGRTIAFISSTSNLVPNPAHLGYYLSKLCLKKMAPLLQSKDPRNRYKVVELGPVTTAITRNTPPLLGWQRTLFDWLKVGPETAAQACLRFFESPKSFFAYPRFAYYFYWGAKIFLTLFPKVYRGTQGVIPETMGLGNLPLQTKQVGQEGL